VVVRDWEAPRSRASTAQTAFDAEDGDIALVGPLSAIIDQGKMLGLTLMLARPRGPLLAIQIIPTSALDVDTPKARARFRAAILQSLARHCRVHAYTSIRQLIAAAGEPQREALPLFISTCRGALLREGVSICSARYFLLLRRPARRRTPYPRPLSSPRNKTPAFSNANFTFITVAKWACMSSPAASSRLTVIIETPATSARLA
jgi:hypothetical protein